MRKHLRDSILTGHVICIPEGSAEDEIISILFKNDKLLFKKNDVLEEEELIRSFSRTRQGRKFAKENLEMDYGENHINILRILDSKGEKFNLGRIYDERIESEDIRIFDILTRPEIEILVIIQEGHYNDFTNKYSKIKASDYCKTILKLKNVKSKSFISTYFNDPDLLIDSIKKYRQLHSKKDECCLYDLLDID